MPRRRAGPARSEAERFMSAGAAQSSFGPRGAARRVTEGGPRRGPRRAPCSRPYLPRPARRSRRGRSPSHGARRRRACPLSAGFRAPVRRGRGAFRILHDCTPGPDATWPRRDSDSTFTELVRRRSARSGADQGGVGSVELARTLHDRGDLFSKTPSQSDDTRLCYVFDSRKHSASFSAICRHFAPRKETANVSQDIPRGRYTDAFQVCDHQIEVVSSLVVKVLREASVRRFGDQPPKPDSRPLHFRQRPRRSRGLFDRPIGDFVEDTSAIGISEELRDVLLEEHGTIPMEQA